MDIEISFLEDIDKLNEDQQREVFDIDSQTGVASEAVDVFDLVMNKTSSEEWTMIAKFYLLEGFNSEHKNVSIPNKCAGIDVKNIRTIPSEKQMIAALEIKEDALAQGFAYIPTET